MADITELQQLQLLIEGKLSQGRVVEQKATLEAILSELSSDDAANATLIAGLQTQINNFARPAMTPFVASAQAGNARTLNLASTSPAPFEYVTLDAPLTYTVQSAAFASGYREGSLDGKNTGIQRVITLTPNGVPIRVVGSSLTNPQFVIPANRTFEFFFRHNALDGFIKVDFKGGHSLNGADAGGGLAIGGGGGSGQTNTSVFTVVSPGDDGYFIGSGSFNTHYNRVYLDSIGYPNITTFFLLTLTSGEPIPTTGTVTGVTFKPYTEGPNSQVGTRTATIKLQKAITPTAVSSISDYNARTLTTEDYAWNGGTWSTASQTQVPINLGSEGVTMMGEILGLGGSTPVSKILLTSYGSSGGADAGVYSRDNEISAGLAATLEVTWTS